MLHSDHQGENWLELQSKNNTDVIISSSGVMCYQTKTENRGFLSEPWRTNGFCSHVSGFNQGNFGQVI